MKKFPCFSIVLLFVFLVSSLDLAAADFDIGQILNNATQIREDPIIPFKELDDKLVNKLSRENRHYISNDNALLEQIKSNLQAKLRQKPDSQSQTLKWRLRSARSFLAFVPEEREAHIGQCLAYYRHTVNVLVSALGKASPYTCIRALRREETHLRHHIDEQSGISVFVVNNKAQVYTEEYLFFVEANSKKISIKLNNLKYLGEIGSFSSYYIHRPDPNACQPPCFEQDNFSLWRSTAADPINILIVPVEETLHILLRPATHRSLLRQVQASNPADLAEVEAITHKYLQLEEAVAAALVYKFLPPYLSALSAAVDHRAIYQALTGYDFEKYSLRPAALANLAEYEFTELFQLYQKNPDLVLELIGS